MDTQEAWMRGKLAQSILANATGSTAIRALHEAQMALDGASIEEIADTRKEEENDVVQSR
jgi:hypothetical protein